MDIAPFAEISDLSEGVLNIYFLAFAVLPAGDADISAADGLHPQATDFPAILQGYEVQRVGMAAGQYFLGEDNLRGQGRQRLPQHPVCAVAYACLAQGAIKDHLKAVRLGILRAKQPRRPFRPHGVGRGRTLADFIYLPNGLHNETSNDLVALKQSSPSLPLGGEGGPAGPDEVEAPMIEWEEKRNS